MRKLNNNDTNNDDNNAQPCLTVAHQAPLSMRFFRQEILEWVAISLSRGPPPPRGRTRISSVSYIAGGFFTCRAIWVVCNTVYVGLASLVAQLVRTLPVVQETRVPALGQEDQLEKEMAPHSSILAWKSHGQRSTAGYSPCSRKSWTRLND